MIVRYSHRIEDLVTALAGRVAASAELGDPLAPETIAVQGRGMERWLSMELSRRLGVWANPDFPFPRALIERAFRSLLGEPAMDPRRFEPEALTWAVAARLQGLSGRPGFEDLQRYLAVDPTPARRVQLASRIAYGFDRYVIYRPEMIAAWESGRDTGWQAVLWRDLVAQLGGEHLAARAGRFLEATREEGGTTPSSSSEPSSKPLSEPLSEPRSKPRSKPRTAFLPDFPARISLFGITTLPPLYVELLAAISRHVDVELFLLRPAGQPRSSSPADNPLWASLGEVGRQFQQVLEDHTVRENAPVIQLPSGSRDLGAIRPAPGPLVKPEPDEPFAQRHRTLLIGLAVVFGASVVIGLTALLVALVTAR